MITTYHDFLVSFSMLLLLSSLAIIGLYIITRGEKTTLPDGTIRVKGKILRQWSLFWEQKTGTTRHYCQGEELQKKIAWLRQCNPTLGFKIQAVPEYTSLEILSAIAAEEYGYMRDLLQWEIQINDKYLFFYVDEPTYKYPEWLRFPLSQCPPCMASVYGTAIYWLAFITLGNCFAWASWPTFAVLAYWIIFCVALSALNKLVYNLVGA